MSESLSPSAAVPPADPDVVARFLMVWAFYELSPKAKRRLVKAWGKLGLELCARAEDAGNVYPINGGGLPAHQVPSALEMAAAGRVILAAVHRLSDQKGR